MSSRHLLVPLSHLPVEQSLSAPQSRPTMHLPHSAPPQSTSVSADTASLTPLEQEVQTRLPSASSAHCPPAQSPCLVHAAPSAQSAHLSQ